MTKRTPSALGNAIKAAAAKASPATEAPQTDFRDDVEPEAVTVAGAVATITTDASGRKILHVQVPLDFGALRCKVAAAGEDAPTSAYLPFQARLDAPKGVRVGGNVHVPLRLLHAPTVERAVANWRAAKAKVKAERVVREDEKLG